jgi:hypothetical protein
MCGIVGKYNLNEEPVSPDLFIVVQMIQGFMWIDMWD